MSPEHYRAGKNKVFWPRKLFLEDAAGTYENRLIENLSGATYPKSSRRRLGAARTYYLLEAFLTFLVRLGSCRQGRESWGTYDL